MHESAQANRIVDLVLQLNALETLPRMGFLMSGVTAPESVAAHCFGVALTAMLMADAMAETVDADRVLRMALVHEVGEASITDLPYGALQYLAPSAKSQAEAAAVRDLLGPLDGRYVSLWEEFEAAETLEARLVRTADKIQLMVKVLQYEREGRGDLSEFWRNAGYNEDDRGISLARELFREIRRRREDRGEGVR